MTATPRTRRRVAPTTVSGVQGAHSDAQRQWAMFFPARPKAPTPINPKTGKPRRNPPVYPPNINERRRMNPFAESKLIAYWRQLGKFEAKRHQMPELDRVKISAIVYRRAMGVADASGDHERLKPLVDGIVDAGVLPNDNRKHVEYGSVEEQRINYRGPGILLIVERLEAPHHDHH